MKSLQKLFKEAMMPNIFTEAPTYMTIFTIYSFFIPFFLLYSISQVKKKKIRRHIYSQAFFLGLTVLFVFYFELMVRINGGFLEYIEKSLFSYDFLMVYLFVHVFIAIFSFGAWIYLYISTLRAYNKKSKYIFDKKFHKKIGIYVFIGMTMSSILGILMYIFLFIR